MKLRLPRLWRGGQKLSAYLEQFLRDELPGLLQDLGRPPAKKIERFPLGGNAVIRKVTFAEGKPLVLRLYRADSPKQPCHSHCYLNRELAKAGILVPNILLRRPFEAAGNRPEFEAVIEDFVEGTLIDDRQRSDTEVHVRLVKLLHCLHGNHSSRPGRIWLNAPDEDPTRAALAKAPELLRRARSQIPGIPMDEVERAQNWIRKSAEDYRPPEVYELTHGDFCRQNLVLTPNNEIALVDLGTIAYGCFITDLVRARREFFDEAWWESFCRDYFADHPDRLERFERDGPLYYALHALIKASSRAVKVRKTLQRDKPEQADLFLAEGRKFWDTFASYLEE